MSRLALLAVAGAMLVLAAPAAQAQHAPLDTMGLARRYTTWFYGEQGDSLFALVTPRFKERMSSPGKFKETYQAVRAAVGEEDHVTREEIAPRETGGFIYRRTAIFKKVPVSMQVIWVVEADGKIDGLLSGSESMLSQAKIR